MSPRITFWPGRSLPGCAARLWRGRSRSLRASVTGGVISATLAASALVLGTTSAQAAPVSLQNAGQYCGTFGSGTTIDINGNGGTVWYKKPPGCHDLNVTNSNSPGRTWDDYAGFWWNGHTWVEGTKAYLYLANGKHDPNTNPNAVLLTNVATGTPMMIGGYYAVFTQDSVWINY